MSAHPFVGATPPLLIGPHSTLITFRDTSHMLHPSHLSHCVTLTLCDLCYVTLAAHVLQLCCHLRNALCQREIQDFQPVLSVGLQVLQSACSLEVQTQAFSVLGQLVDQGAYCMGTVLVYAAVAASVAALGLLVDRAACSM
jgi:hypothetical protein